MLYIVFEKYYKGLYCKSNGLGWFARFRIQFLPDHYNDPFLSSVCVCHNLVPQKSTFIQTLWIHVSSEEVFRVEG